MANERPEYADILLSTKAVIFLATPHQGSDKAYYGSILASIINTVMCLSLLDRALGKTRSDLVKLLRSQSPILEEVALSFRSRADHMEIVSFYETRAYAPFTSMVSSSSPVFSLLRPERTCHVRR